MGKKSGDSRGGVRVDLIIFNGFKQVDNNVLKWPLRSETHMQLFFFFFFFLVFDISSFLLNVVCIYAPQSTKYTNTARLKISPYESLSIQVRVNFDPLIQEFFIV